MGIKWKLTIQRVQWHWNYVCIMFYDKDIHLSVLHIPMYLNSMCISKTWQAFISLIWRAHAWLFHASTIAELDFCFAEIWLLISAELDFCRIRFLLFFFFLTRKFISWWERNLKVVLLAISSFKLPSIIHIQNTLDIL